MMKINISDVLAKLEKVTKNSNGFQAKCPAHDDRNPSLSIAEGDNGKVLFKCHSGCKYEDIVQALGVFEREQNEQNEQKKKEVATYDYVDENGNLLYQAVRYEPKDFRTRRPDEKGNYIWNLENTRRVIYRLPEILQARGEDFYVIFCEGEKDADNVRERLDFPATTIVSGVGSWKDEYADSLFGLNVVILPDNDKAGKDFAEKVANSIYNKAQSVRVINLPNLPEKGDASDWIEDGGTREQLIQLIDVAAEWQVTNSANKEADYNHHNNENFFIVKPASDWIEEAKSKPIPKMIFGELWFEDELCILFADSNVGKSILAVQIADSITQAKPIDYFPLEVEPQKVLYFDFELGDRQFANRYCENKNGCLVNNYQFSKDFLRVAINPDNNYAGEMTYEECLVNQIESSIVETGIKILIIDNISIIKSDNERAKDALPLMQNLKALKRKHNLSILILAHTPKRDLSRVITQNDLAGSKMLMNFCDSSFSIGQSNNGESVRYLKQIKERNTGKIYGSDNVCVAEVRKPNNFLSLNFFAFGEEQEHLKAKTNKGKESVIQQVVDLKAQDKTHREIAATLEISTGTVTNYLSEAEELSILPSSSVQVVHSVQTVQPLFDLNNMNVEKDVEKELDLPF